MVRPTGRPRARSSRWAPPALHRSAVLGIRKGARSDAAPGSNAARPLPAGPADRRGGKALGPVVHRRQLAYVRRRGTWRHLGRRFAWRLAAQDGRPAVPLTWPITREMAERV